jgi:hypothetical protein
MAVVEHVQLSLQGWEFRELSKKMISQKPKFVSGDDWFNRCLAAPNMRHLLYLNQDHGQPASAFVG